MNSEYLKITADKLNDLLKRKSVFQDFTQQPLELINYKLEEGLVFPKESIYDTEFINRIVNIVNVNRYRYFITLLEQNNFALAKAINEIRKQQIADEVLIGKIDEVEVIIDIFFEDFPYNVIKNIKDMLCFIKETNSHIIPEDRKQLYHDILNYENLDLVEKIKLFKRLELQKNLLAKFYDDIRACRDLSYALIKNKLLSPDEMSPLFSEFLSAKYQRQVYELAGQPFYMLVIATHRSRDARQYSVFTTNAKTSSYSLISNENINTFLPADNNIILGFADFNINNVMLVFEGDAYTRHEYGSKIMPKLYTPESLITKTVNYNELLYKNEEYDESSHSYARKPLLPNYIVCYDKICEGDLSASKIHDIPIILVHSEFYQKKEGQTRIISDDDKAFLDRFDKFRMSESDKKKEKACVKQI